MTLVAGKAYAIIRRDECWYAPAYIGVDGTFAVNNLQGNPMAVFMEKEKAEAHLTKMLTSLHNADVAYWHARQAELAEELAKWDKRRELLKEADLWDDDEDEDRPVSWSPPQPRDPDDYEVVEIQVIL